MSQAATALLSHSRIPPQQTTDAEEKEEGKQEGKEQEAPPGVLIRVQPCSGDDRPGKGYLAPHQIEVPSFPFGWEPQVVADAPDGAGLRTEASEETLHGAAESSHRSRSRPAPIDCAVGRCW